MTTAGESAQEKTFWRLWLGGLLLLAVMIAINPSLSNEVAPFGISDHQAAASAAKVNLIQQQWQADGVLWLAQTSMAIDLIFIVIYGIGAATGGQMLRGHASPRVRRLGNVVLGAAVVFIVSDYSETICQFIQLLEGQGTDSFAALAAAARPIKSIAFMITLSALPVALWLRRRADRPS
ncbi:MAG: hypothetical protein RJB02_361 [Pseudomonadota bacterium]